VSKLNISTERRRK